MDKILVNNKIERDEWENFISQHEEANFLQSWNWGEFHNNLGNIIARRGFYRGGKLIGVLLSVVENAKRGRYLTVPAGPIIDWNDEMLVESVFREIKKVAIENACVFVRIRPALVEGEFANNIFRKYKCVNAPMHLHAELSNILDIEKTEEQLLAQMRKTTRYEIRKAQNLKIKITTSKDEKLIKSFYDLQVQTSKRQNFVPFSYDFFLQQFKVFFNSNEAFLYTATYDNKILAQAFIIFYGKEAVYHYGASTEDGRKYPGAYFLQWEAIKEAKKRGMKRYNFWGVAPVEEKSHRFYGVSVFKRGFGGEDIAYLHAKDLVINKYAYLINYIIENIRKRMRRV